MTRDEIVRVTGLMTEINRLDREIERHQQTLDVLQQINVSERRLVGILPRRDGFTCGVEIQLPCILNHFTTWARAQALAEMARLKDQIERINL